MDFTTPTSPNRRPTGRTQKVNEWGPVRVRWGIQWSRALFVPFVLAVVGCGPSEEELARREKVAEQLIGHWEGGDWKITFSADGNYSDKKKISQWVDLSRYAARKGKWKIDHLDGPVAVIALECKKSDVYGYWIGEDETSRWFLFFEPTEGGLKFESGWTGESWIELSAVEEDSEDEAPE